MLDLLVLGAGPAGCAAAIAARRAGLSATILEINERTRPVPGETLHPGIEPVFVQLGVREAVLAAQFHRHRGVWVEWNEPRRFEAYGAEDSGDWLGFQANRRRLHDILIKRALDLGVDLHRPMRPEAALVDQARVKGVIAGEREWRACWTVDATGRQAWLARALKLQRKICSPPMYAQFGWSADADCASDGQPSITAVSEGWRWHAPLGSGRTAWVALTVDAPDAPPTAPGGVDVSWRIHPACAGAGYFLLGDAAVTLDPSSSHGVLRAIMSGMLCGHLISAQRRESAPENNLMAAYRQWIAGQFDHDVDALRMLYMRHPSPRVSGLFGDFGPASDGHAKAMSPRT